MNRSDPGAIAFRELALHYEKTVDAELQKFWGISYAGLVKFLLESAQIQEAETVLDLATGTGLIPRTIGQDSNHFGQVVGIDITCSVLESGRRMITKSEALAPIQLVCGSALSLPFAKGFFDWVICALASHHIDQAQLLAQAYAALKPGGRFLLADVAASPTWQIPGVRMILRCAAYAYFLINESPSRAWVEADAVSHVYTAEQWTSCLEKSGFSSIVNHSLAGQRSWAPSAMLMVAAKN